MFQIRLLLGFGQWDAAEVPSTEAELEVTFVFVFLGFGFEIFFVLHQQRLHRSLEYELVVFLGPFGRLFSVADFGESRDELVSILEHLLFKVSLELALNDGP